MRLWSRLLSAEPRAESQRVQHPLPAGVKVLLVQCSVPDTVIEDVMGEGLAEVFQMFLVHQTSVRDCSPADRFQSRIPNTFYVKGQYLLFDTGFPDCCGKSNAEVVSGLIGVQLSTYLP